MLQFHGVPLIVLFVDALHPLGLLSGLLDLFQHLFFFHLQFLDARLHNLGFQLGRVCELLRVQHGALVAQQ